MIPIEVILSSTPLANRLEVQPSLPYNIESLSINSRISRLSISTENRGPHTAELSPRIRYRVVDSPELTLLVIRLTRYRRVLKRIVFPNSII